MVTDQKTTEITKGDISEQHIDIDAMWWWMIARVTDDCCSVWYCGCLAGWLVERVVGRCAMLPAVCTAACSMTLDSRQQRGDVNWRISDINSCMATSSWVHCRQAASCEPVSEWVRGWSIWSTQHCYMSVTSSHHVTAAIITSTTTTISSSSSSLQYQLAALILSVHADLSPVWLTNVHVATQLHAGGHDAPNTSGRNHHHLCQNSSIPADVSTQYRLVTDRQTQADS